MLVTRMPALALGIIEGLSFKGRCYSALAQMLATRSAAERLAHLLLQLVDLYGIPGARGVWIDASFTHADLGHMTGVTRQWITATLQQYRDRGIIEMKGRRLTIRDLGFLQHLRDGGLTLSAG
jgi:CRP-like cAMP-binding protein